MNAILQCFIHTPTIKSYFTSELYKNNISKDAKRINGKILADLIGSFSKEYSTLDDPIVSLRKLRAGIARHLSQFQGYDQHDAQEFLAMLIDKLTEELTVSVATNFSKTASAILFNNNKSTEKVSAMRDFFSGKLCTRVTCPHCKNSIEKEDSFCYLSIPLPLEVI
jgi:ubiquitin carboxyl-terminal hydrolase 4/11/15